MLKDFRFEWLNTETLRPGDELAMADLMLELSKKEGKESHRPDLSSDFLSHVMAESSRHCAVMRFLPANGLIVATGTLFTQKAVRRAGQLTGDIEEVATLDGYKGRGLASRIMDALEAQAWVLTVFRLRLHTSREDALAFYRKRGWTEYQTTMMEKFPS